MNRFATSKRAATRTSSATIIVAAGLAPLSDFHVAGSARLDGSLIAGGTITGGGNLTLDGSVDVAGGVFADGNLIADGSLFIENGAGNGVNLTRVEVVPEVVKTHDWQFPEEEDAEPELVELERMGMSYTDLVPVLIKAVQQQQVMIDDLRTTNAELEMRLQRLEQLLIPE